MKSRGKKIGIVIAAALVALVGYIASGPYRALGAVRMAAFDGDHTALRARIDFEQVKAGLKADWKAKVAEQASAGTPTSALFTEDAIDRTVDDWAEPASLARAARGELPDKEKPAAFASLEAELTTGGNTMTGTYLALDRFRADFMQGTAPTFSVTLQRRGLSWRVVRVELVELRLAPKRPP